MIEALKYLHGKGIMHLDLQLKNFMFENSNLKTILLLDFGIQKMNNLFLYYLILGKIIFKLQKIKDFLKQNLQI